VRPCSQSYLGGALGAGCLFLLLASRAAAQGDSEERAPSPSAPAASRQALADRLAAAERAYAELRLEDADSEIHVVLGELALGHDAELTPEGRVRAHVLAAAIARARGDLAASDVALDAALELEPSLRLDPALHPPPLLEALERRRALRTVSTPIVPVEQPDAGPVVSTPLGRDIIDAGHDDPWPWVGLGVGGALLLGGAIALSVVLSTPPSSFDVRGTIIP